MGCCFSTQTKAAPHSDRLGHRRLSSPTMDRAPPVAEEETVKEVLSEIPIVPKKLEILKLDEKESEVEEEKLEVNCVVEKVAEVEVAASEVSQASEMYSMSESFSTATTVTEKREDEVVSKFSGQRVTRSPAKAPRKRPYAGEVPRGREERAKAMGKRTPPGPRPVRGRESGPVRPRQRNVGSPGAKRDPGESSGRRSRSPATRTAGGGVRGVVYGPMKKTGTAAGRSVEIGKESNEGDKKVKERNDTVSEGGNDAGLQDGNYTVLEGKESIENPLVSLECFIFL